MSASEELEVNLIVFAPVEKYTSSEVSSMMTVFTSPVQEVFSFGAYPDGTRIIPLALPYSSVVILPLNTVEEFPATPVNLESGFTQRPISLFSIKTLNCVLGFILLIMYLMGTDLAKNLSEFATLVPLMVLYPTPLAISLFCGLMLEEVATVALCTVASAVLVLFSAKLLRL